MDDEDLRVLPDGSICVSSRFQDRYSTRSGIPTEYSPLTDGRTWTEKDRGKVNYSQFQRRLSGVTQVLSPDPDHPTMHSRLTHSQKVALVSREISETLCRRALAEREKSLPEAPTLQAIVSYGGLDIAAAEVAGLCHDFGHPPFGHTAERVLDHELRFPHVTATYEGQAVEDGFEGNAQTFRILSRLDAHHQKLEGLELRNVTLAAVQKYPYPRGGREYSDLSREDRVRQFSPGQKFGAYETGGDDETDRSRVNRAVTGSPNGRGMSLEASIMDLADDITYAVHDFEDFYSENMFRGSRLSRILRDAIQALDQASIPLRAGSDEAASQADGRDGCGPKDRPSEILVQALDIAPGNTFIELGSRLLRYSPAEFLLEQFQDSLARVQQNVSEFLTFDFDRSVGDASALREFSSLLIKSFFDAIQIRPDGIPGKPAVFLDSPEWHYMQVLKSITRHFILESPVIGLSDRSITRTVQIAFRGLEHWVVDAGEFGALPEPLSSYLPEPGPARVLPADSRRSGSRPCITTASRRAIADYLCYLTDARCLSLARWLSGTSAPSISSSI